MTEALQPGVVTQIKQNVVYAIGNKQYNLVSDQLIQSSPTFNGTFSDLTSSNSIGVTIYDGTAGFIRCAVANASVLLQKYNSIRPS